MQQLALVPDDSASDPSYQSAAERHCGQFSWDLCADSKCDYSKSSPQQPQPSTSVQPSLSTNSSPRETITVPVETTSSTDNRRPVESRVPDVTTEEPSDILDRNGQDLGQTQNAPQTGDGTSEFGSGAVRRASYM